MALGRMPIANALVEVVLGIFIIFAA